MAQNRKRIRAQKELVENITKEDNPIKTSIFIFIFWELIVILFAVLFYYVGKNTSIRSVEIASGLGISVSAFWLMLRIGLLEKVQLKYKNWKNSKIIDKFGEKQDIKLTIEQHRVLVKKRSWIGISILFSMNLITTLSVVFL